MFNLVLLYAQVDNIEFRITGKLPFAEHHCICHGCPESDFNRT